MEEQSFRGAGNSPDRQTETFDGVVVSFNCFRDFCSGVNLRGGGEADPRDCAGGRGAGRYNGGC